MLLVDSVSPSVRVVSSADGFDSDHDGRAEYVLRKDVGTLWTTVFEIYESVSDNTFDLVHVLGIPPDSDSSYYPGDLGDADGDGLAELTVFGRTVNDFFIRLYESESPETYPRQLVWELEGHTEDGDFWQVGAKIRDTDDDERLEVVLAGQESNLHRIAVYENEGNNSFVLTYYQIIPLTTSQSMEVADDLDGDGKDEILLGGLEAATTKVYAVENVGDNAYVQAWSKELIHTDGQRINVETIVDAGDLDQDGRKEFLAGGLKTIGSPSDPFFSVLYLFETTGNDSFEPVASFVLPTNAFGDTSAKVADVDGDGDLEIVFGTLEPGESLSKHRRQHLVGSLVQVQLAYPVHRRG